MSACTFYMSVLYKRYLIPMFSRKGIIGVGGRLLCALGIQLACVHSVLENFAISDPNIPIIVP